MTKRLPDIIDLPAQVPLKHPSSAVRSPHLHTPVSPSATHSSPGLQSTSAQGSIKMQMYLELAFIYVTAVLRY